MHSFDEVIRVAVVADPDRLSDAALALLEALGRHPLPGFRIDLPGSGVPVGADHDLVHLLTPFGAAAALAGEHLIPVVGDLAALGTPSMLPKLRLLLSPGAAGDAASLAAGARPGQLRHWQPGIDLESFGPGHYRSAVLPREPDRINVLHVGVAEAPELLAAAFGAAAALDPRLHLVGLPDAHDRAELFASADLLLHHRSDHRFPISIREAQASGLPVLALDSGVARDVIEDGRTGVIVPPETGALSEALLVLARRGPLRERLMIGGLNAVRSHSWDAALAGLARAWSAALAPARPTLVRAA